MTTTLFNLFTRLAQTRAQTEAEASSKFFQLSTIDALDGSPRCRTVACRDSTEEIMMFTSTKAAKWADLKKDSRFEICWYFAKTWEQYRIRGNKVEMYTKPHPVAEKVWNNLAPQWMAKFENNPQEFGVLVFKPNFAELYDTKTGATAVWRSSVL